MISLGRMEYARHWSVEKGVWHYAIIDHADRLGLIGWARPVIVELVPTGLRARPFDPSETWERTAIADTLGALRRLRQLLAMKDRQVYDWFLNNCEHIARYIAFGEFRSEQVQAVVALAGLGVMFLVLREAA